MISQQYYCGIPHKKAGAQMFEPLLFLKMFFKKWVLFVRRYIHISERIVVHALPAGIEACDLGTLTR